MREQESEAVVCLCCGARAGAPLKARVVTVTWDEERGRAVGLARAAPKRRSGLAHAAGYAGLAYLVGYSLAPAAGGQRLLAGLGAYGQPVPLPFWNLWAQAALVLAFAAAYSMDRARDREGALPALLGLLVGLWGTLVWLFDLLAPGGILSAGL
jgi:hypothetical protein